MGYQGQKRKVFTAAIAVISLNVFILLIPLGVVVGHRLFDKALPSDVANLLFWANGAIGLAQLLYVLPICWWLKRRRRFATLQGALIGTLITFFLTSGCYLLVFF